MRLLMRCLASRTSENSPSETVWKFGIDPESGLRSGQEGSKKSRSAASWRQRRVLETPSAIFQTVSEGEFSEVRLHDRAYPRSYVPRITPLGAPRTRRSPGADLCLLRWVDVPGGSDRRRGRNYGGSPIPPVPLGGGLCESG